MAKYSLVMTPTPCRVDVCIISIRHSCIYLLTYSLAYTSARGYKAGNISKTVEDRAKVTINGLYKVVHWLSILPPKCMTLNHLLVRFEVIIP